MRGRATHENVYGEVKRGFAFDCAPTQYYQAKNVWHVLSILALNLMRALQSCTAERCRTNRKRRAIRALRMIHTLRYQLINLTGLLVQPYVSFTLDVGNNSIVRNRFQAIEQALAG